MGASRASLMGTARPRAGGSGARFRILHSQRRPSLDRSAEALAGRANEAKTGNVELPETRYAHTGDLSVAYQEIGEGPPDLIYIPSGFHHVELSWQVSRIAQFLRRLASLGRVLRFDKRGTRHVRSPD
jgi:hypothetical protein